MDLTLIKGIIATQGSVKIKFEHGKVFIITITGTATEQHTKETETEILAQLNENFKVWFQPLASTSLMHVYNVRPR